MHEAATALSAWESFYVIVGSSAGALIGLRFVVLTLISERPHAQMEEASAAFATPSVVHFGVVLFLCAIGSMPWHTTTALAAIWGTVGVVGLVYTLIVVRRMRSQKAYRPVLEDWLFHAVLPLAAYLVLLVAALIGTRAARQALFLVGAAALAYLFVGIHNAWDAVTWHVFTQRKRGGKNKYLFTYIPSL